jgi:uncharacterized protein YdcH (DUF465 family)
MKRFAATLAVALGLAMLVSPAWADEAKKPAGKNIDVVICLDISGSMDGLIASAKTKLWDIVNELAKAKPTPTLRVALYSYGCDAYEKEKGWVRKDVDFTSDLDKINEKLFSYRTNGGTEYPTRVARDAIQELKWSEDPAALKIIFVCGNEPVDQDKSTPVAQVAELAVRKGIIINTIYCEYGHPQEAKGWKEYADLSEGRFASISMAAGTVAIATPFDKELAELSGKINTTFCFYGKEAKQLAANQVAQDKNAAALGGAVAAQRGQSKGGALYRFEDHDLVEKCRLDPKFDVKTVKEEELSDEMKKMKPEEREAHVKKLLAQREELQKKISEIGKKRDLFVAEEMKKSNVKGEQAFDEAVRGAIRDQAKKKGIDIP